MNRPDAIDRPAADVSCAGAMPGIGRHGLDNCDQAIPDNPGLDIARIEAKYPVLLEQIPAVIYLRSPEAGNPTVYISPRIEKLLGFSPAKWLADPELWARQIHPHDKGRVLAEASCCLSGDFCSEYRLIAGDGHQVWVRDEARLVWNEEARANFIQGILLDITHQKRAETALDRIRWQNDLILYSVADGILGLDTQGVITFANPAASRMLGWKNEELIGKQMHRLIHHSKPDGSPCPEEECLICCAQTNLTMFDMDEVFWRKDGACFDIESTSTPITGREGIVGTVIVFKDVTERRKEDKERLLLATAIEQSAESVMITDRYGVIQYTNPAFEQITGYAREEAVGRKPDILKSGKHDQNFYRAMWDTINRGETWSGHLNNQRKDGTVCEIEESISPVRDKYGKITSFVAVMRDVTLESQIEKQLRHAQKMEAIGTLAGGIAHDFNNILSAIVGHTELALNKLPEQTPAGYNLDQVLNAGLRAKDLVKQILTVSRQTEQGKKPVEVALIIKEVVKLLRPSLPATIEIRQELPANPESALVMADPTEIHQVLMNLCTNAAHAMRAKGGILSLQLSEIVVDALFLSQHPDLKTGSYVRLTVSDTGHGMGDAVMERIFNPYFTTKKLGEGTGLGLSVVQGIVKGCSGAINVASVPEKGTEFNLFLPKIEGKAPVQGKAAKPACQLPTGTERILFIDDEQTLADLGREFLTSLGYDAVACTNPLEVLDLFRADPSGFDLVITDMTMPGLTGEELAKELLSIQPDLPIILSTGYSELIDEKSARKIGVRAVLMKPYTIANFATRIREVLEHGKRGS